MDPSLAALHYVKLAELWKLPDLAKKVSEVASAPKQPGPMQEKLMALQIAKAEQELRNEKMKEQILMKQMDDYDSKIHERISRSLENSEDIRNKAAQAMLREEQARKLRSETDMIDKEFVKDITGQRELEAERMETLKANAAKAQETHAALVEVDKLRLEKGYGIGKDNQSEQGDDYGM
jgi:hypothetical protein